MPGFVSAAVSVSQLLSNSLDASIGGVDFFIIDSRHEVGRRLQAFLFPGRDDRNFQDLGAFDGPIRISGMLAGDDYIAQGADLHTTLRQPGPLTLVHPWLGTLDVVLERPASIRFAQDELRIVRFEASFLPYDPFVSPGFDTLQALLFQINKVTGNAEKYLTSLLAPAILPLAIFGFAVGLAQRFAGFWSTLSGAGGNDGLAPIGPAIAPALDTLTAPIADGTDPRSVTPIIATNLLAVPAAAAAASVPTPPAAVAPGGSTVTPAAADAQGTANLIFASVLFGANYKLMPAPGPGVAAALAAAAVANALLASADIQFESQQAARAWTAVALPQIDAAIDAVLAQAQGSPAIVGALWQSLVSLRASFMADMNDEIGRLPAVKVLTTERSVSAWLIAQHLAGDTPGAVAATYRDLVARNKVAHPAIVPAGAVEYLQ
jgi:hypothetical protein